MLINLWLHHLGRGRRYRLLGRGLWRWAPIEWAQHQVFYESPAQFEHDYKCNHLDNEPLGRRLWSFKRVPRATRGFLAKIVELFGLLAAKNSIKPAGFLLLKAQIDFDSVSQASLGAGEQSLGDRIADEIKSSAQIATRVRQRLGTFFIFIFLFFSLIILLEFDWEGPGLVACGQGVSDILSFW